MNADAKAATLDLHLWSEGCGFAVEHILISKMQGTAVRTAIPAGRTRP
jgi:hypothetical protein